MTARRTASVVVLLVATVIAPHAAAAQRIATPVACCAAAALPSEYGPAAPVADPVPAGELDEATTARGGSQSLSPHALTGAATALSVSGGGRGGITAEEARRRMRWAPLASAALPGGGQALLGQQRFLPYLALEGYALLRLLADSREGRRQRSAYRKLARTVARAPLSPVTPAGNWEYYERMEHFVESGAFDVDPSAVLGPEPDSTTYNGSVWLLARQTYWEDPGAPPPPSSAAYESAITFYRQRAVTPEFRWSWRNAELEQDVFRRTIARSNDAYRRAAQDLAVVIANHVLSTVDAYVTVRLRGRRLEGGSRGTDPASREAYSVVLQLPLPRLAPPSR